MRARQDDAAAVGRVADDQRLQQRRGTSERLRVARRSQLGEQGFFRAAEKLLDHVAEGLRARFFGGQIGAIDVGAAGLSALDDALAGEAIHDGHDGGVGARQPRRQTVANFADGAFAHGPEGVHAIEFEGADPKGRGEAGGLFRTPGSWELNLVHSWKRPDHPFPQESFRRALYQCS